MRWNFMTWLVIICLVLLGSALVIYFVRFNGGFSEDQTDFGTFGDYLNPFLSLVSIILLGYISFRANALSGSFNTIQLRPVLFLTHILAPSKSVKEDETWIIKNAYAAPAINILVKVIINTEKEIATKWVNCMSIESQSCFELLWVRHANIIEVMWSNINNNQHYCVSTKDWNANITTVNKTTYDNALEEARKIGRDGSFINRAFLDFIKNDQLKVDKLDFTDYERFLKQWKLLK